MELTFLGAAETVTGSKYLFRQGNEQFLVDCGLFQGLKELRLRNWQPLPFHPEDLAHVILTHAHIDHSGYVPRLCKQGFKGNVLCTPGTKDLCEVLLPDSGFLQEEEAELANKFGYSKHKPALPLYTMEDAINALGQFRPIPFHQPIPIAKDVVLEFMHAGHIIGASLVSIRFDHQTIVFSGDLGRPHDQVMRSPETPPQADILVLESTYGDRIHPDTHPRQELADAINRAVNRGGSVIIPAFAVGRSQCLMYFLHELKEQGKIPNVPVYLDSPMATSATEIFKHYPQEHRLSPEMVNGMCRDIHYVKTADESKAIDEIKEPIIIISASGMATGGRVLHHIKAFGDNPKNLLLFSGYQAEGTRGQRILSGEKQIKMFGEMVEIKAEVAALDNLSAHSDCNETLKWLHTFKHHPKQVYIVHGEPASAAALKKRIQDELGWKCIIPQYGQKVKL